MEKTLGIILEELLAPYSEILRAMVITARGVAAQSSRKNWAIPWGVVGFRERRSESEMTLITSMLLNLTHTLTRRETRSTLTRIYLANENGNISINAAGPQAILVVYRLKVVKLGFVELDIQKACKKIQEIIPTDYPDIILHTEPDDLRVQISRILQLPDTGETTLGSANEKPALKEHEVLGTLLEVLFVLCPEILRAVIITGRGLVAQKYSRTVTGSRDPIECPRPLSDSDVALLLSMVLNLTSTLMRHETQILIRHTNGYISLMPAGSRAILGIFVPMEVKLGLVAFEAKKICQKIEEIIPPDYPDMVNRAEDIDGREQISRLLQQYDETKV